MNMKSYIIFSWFVIIIIGILAIEISEGISIQYEKRVYAVSKVCESNGYDISLLQTSWDTDIFRCFNTSKYPVFLEGAIDEDLKVKSLNEKSLLQIQKLTFLGVLIGEWNTSSTLFVMGNVYMNGKLKVCHYGCEINWKTESEEAIM